MKITLREKYPNTEFFLVRIFWYLDQKKLCIWTLVTQCKSQLLGKIAFHTILKVITERKLLRAYNETIKNMQFDQTL